jgi:hypothetical protein
MFGFFADIVAQLLSWAFVIGIAGCLVVIPFAAYQLFSVLFERDRPEEINPSLRVR